MKGFFKKIKRICSPRAALKDYVREKYFFDGVTRGEIERELLLVGWAEDVVKKIFQEVLLKESRRQARAIRNFWRSSERIKKAAKVKKIEKSEKKARGGHAFVRRIRISDIIRLAMRIFRVRLGRTLLTILGIGVSFGTIFFLVSLGYGLEHLLLRQISSEDTLLTLDVFTNNQEVIPLNSDVLQNIKNMDHVKKAYPIVTVPGQIEMGNLTAEAKVYGVPDNYFMTSGIRFTAGKAFSNSDHATVLSSAFSQIFNIADAENLIGKSTSVELYVPQKNIVGTGSETGAEVSTKIVSIDTPLRVNGIVNNVGSNDIYVPFPVVSAINLPYAMIKVVVDKSANFESTRAAIIDEGFNTRAIADTIEQADKIFKVFQVILSLFGIASLVVAMIGMINTMTIALLERIQEIGIMKILGVSSGDIMRLFLFEATMMGFLGGASGLVIGFLASRLFNLGINFLASTLGGNSVELFFYPIWFVVAVIVFASGVGFITGLVPSRRAATMDSLEALRYK